MTRSSDGAPNAFGARVLATMIMSQLTVMSGGSTCKPNAKQVAGNSKTTANPKDKLENVANNGDWLTVSHHS